MKIIQHPICRYMLILLVLLTPATLVEGKKVSIARLSFSASLTNTYHTAAVMKQMLNYNVAVSSICARSAAIALAVKQAAIRTELRMVSAQATEIYSDMDLRETGLSKKAFDCAWLGYHKLQKKGLLHRTGILSICDFSQSSSRERMYVIDVRHRKLLFRTYVAHGINSGEEFASSFSNRPESCKSSLGFYVTRQTYYGTNGLSLRIDGLDKGFNDLASQRNIVIHGASYVSTHILQKYGVMGTTFGCPAIPTEMSTQIIPLVKNGTCFFIYYPSKKYLAGSPVLNG
jgi:L,D-transpeptidase catalytic domain